MVWNDCAATDFSSCEILSDVDLRVKGPCAAATGGVYTWGSMTGGAFGAGEDSALGNDATTGNVLTEGGGASVAVWEAAARAGEASLARGGWAGRPGDTCLMLRGGDVVAMRFREDPAKGLNDLGTGTSIAGPVAERSALPCEIARREMASGNASDGI